MRPIDTNTLNALTGSRAGDALTVWVWYDGALAWPDPLPVSAWSADWDTSRQVQQATFTITDKDGRLAPWLLEDPLGVGGSLLQVTYQVGGAGAVNLGWYRITQSAPAEAWHSYIIDELGRVNTDTPLPQGKRQVLVSGGASISITASDLAINAANSRLLAPESPQGTSPTIISEIARLMDGIAGVTSAAGVTDRAVNKTLIYQEDRLNAVQDLAKRIGCDYRFNGNRQLEIYPLAAQAPVWTIAGGPEGVLVSVNRAQKLDGLYNQFVVDGTGSTTNPNGTTSQNAVRGIAPIVGGPLRWGGPHGKYPKFYSSNMIGTQAEADGYALTMRDTQLAGVTVDLAIECLPHPGLQQGDWVQVIAPTINNQQVSLVGRVTKMGLKSNGSAVDRMSLIVECTYADVQTAIGGVSRG